MLADSGMVLRVEQSTGHIGDRLAQCDGMIKSKVEGWNGYAIWGSPTNRNLWIKFRAPGGN